MGMESFHIDNFQGLGLGHSGHLTAYLAQFLPANGREWPYHCGEAYEKL